MLSRGFKVRARVGIGLISSLLILVNSSVNTSESSVTPLHAPYSMTNSAVAGAVYGAQAGWSIDSDDWIAGK